MTFNSIDNRPTDWPLSDEKAVVAGSLAMDASSNMHTCYYRSGYDFAVPLRHKLEFSNIRQIAPWHRKYFLTVKVTGRCIK